MTGPDWTQWAARRPDPVLLHLDSAAAGRQSQATLAATAAHARLEAELGAYVAQERAAATLEGLRSDVGGLLGLHPDAVAFVESATAGLGALLGAWPRGADARVGVVPAEWGPNLAAFERHGWTPVGLDTDAAGHLDLDALARRLASDPPAVVHLTAVTSHRGLVQPLAEALPLCRAAGVSVWTDAAQSLGHVDCAVAPDAAYATSRKWLTGPRGVGIVAIAPQHWDALTIPRLPLHPVGLPAPRYLESHEAHVPGRVGLANAVRELLADGPPAVFARLAEVGRLTRAALSDVPGWAVVDPAAEPSAITALRPTAGQDVAATRARLLAEHGLVTTAGEPARAPREMREPLLRISPHVDCAPGDLVRLAHALVTDR